jgi:hypothetical protein
VLVIVVATVVLIAQLAMSSGKPAQAADPGAPIMVLIDERDTGAKDAATAIYILWPGQRRVESYNAGSATFTTYDFVSRKVLTRPADVDFQ